MEDRKNIQKIISNWDNICAEFEDNLNNDYFEILQEENIPYNDNQSKSRYKRRYNEIMNNQSFQPVTTKRFKLS